MGEEKHYRGWAKPSKGAKYAGVSLKTFRGMLKNGLRHVRLENNRILIKFTWIDAYLESFEVRDENQSAKAMADELVEGL